MSEHEFSRRAAVVAAAGATLAPGLVMAAAPVVTMLGDSLTAGYGLSRDQALPVKLQARLRALGSNAVVRSAGVNGDTSATALARLDRSVRPDTDVCIVALGGNDLLQISDPARLRANLDQIIRRLKGRGIKVVLVGLAAPAELGGYAGAFNRVYVDLALQHGVPLYPDILAGVARNRALNLPDGIHPNAHGVDIIAERLAPVIKTAL
jgi:acyl-CoA thioesterase I